MSLPARGTGCVTLGAERTLEVYLIGLSERRAVLFSSSDVIDSFEADSDDRIHRMISWLAHRPSRILAWLGRVFESAHGYYVKLEARLDPAERVFKAMAGTRRYRIFHSHASDQKRAKKQLGGILRRQRVKHLFWTVLDLLLSVGSLALAPIPGPNVVGWYPFLRTLSHYRAFRGVHAALNSREIEFKGLPEVGSLEENLQASGFDREKVRAIAGDLKISGLVEFLERMI